MKSHTKGSAAVWLLSVVVVILLIVIGAVLSLSPSSSSTNGRGGTSNGDSISLGSNLNVGGSFVIGTNGGSLGDTGYNGGVGKTEQESIAYCGGSGLGAYTGYPTTYAGSSTQFAVNPYFGLGTSTVTITSIALTGQATSSFLMVGTSTKSVGLVSSDVTPVAASTTIATSSGQRYITPGIAGDMPAGGSNQRSFTVGPNQLVVGYATSSGWNTAGYTQANACQVKMTFTQ